MYHNHRLLRTVEKISKCKSQASKAACPCTISFTTDPPLTEKCSRRTLLCIFSLYSFFLVSLPCSVSSPLYAKLQSDKERKIERESKETTANDGRRSTYIYIYLYIYIPDNDAVFSVKKKKRRRKILNVPVVESVVAGPTPSLICDANSFDNDDNKRFFFFFFLSSSAIFSSFSFPPNDYVLIWISFVGSPVHVVEVAAATKKKQTKQNPMEHYRVSGRD